MGKLIYSMNPSLDGFVAGPDGDFRVGVADEGSLHRLHNARVDLLSVDLGRLKLTRPWSYWETAEEDPAITMMERKFAALQQSC